MKYTGYFTLLFALVMMISCSEETPKTPSIEDVPVTHVSKSGNETYSVANLQIEGMMCEIACVGKVRKELSSIAGVIDTQIDFDEKSTLDMASVKFDPAVTSEREMIETIHAIGDGLYQVRSVEVVTFDHAQTEDTEAEPMGLFIQTDDLFSMPSFFQILSVFTDKIVR